MAVRGTELEKILASVGLNLVRRDEWGARAPKAVNFIQLPTPRLFIHHTADDRQGESIRAHQNYHMDTKGWNDLAYSLMVDNRGVVYEGRGIGVQGGHTAGYNRTSHAICLFGNFQNHPATAAALNTVVTLSKLGRDKKWWVPTLHGHRDVASTSCPGNYLYSALPTLRTRVAAIATPPPVTHVPVNLPVLRRGARGGAVKSLQVLLNAKAGKQLVVDGDFGPATETAVKQLEAFFKLTADGVMDARAWGCLFL